MVSQLLSVVGAALILVAYAGNQRGWTGPDRPAYNLMNLVGALLLLWVALVDRRAGFILLESVWAAVTVPPLWRSLRSDGDRPDSSDPNAS
ncbi:MAG: hypothetical protein R3223_07795 [Longimicrobiales bacterium]|nr:hypothetical protein [Longimicrobiales bacterium]